MGYHISWDFDEDPPAPALIRAKVGDKKKLLIKRGQKEFISYMATVKVYNHGNKAQKFHRGDKVTQLVILPVVVLELVEADELEESERGTDGLGSTGR